MLRWGYKRVTIEEVAKQARIGKGTAYLHFSTRGSLFVSVLTRESVDLVEELIEAIRADPVAMLPAEQAELNYLAVMRRPLLRAMFSRDIEVLGDLANEAIGSPLRAMKVDLAGELCQLWREHGLLRTDLDIDTRATSSTPPRPSSTCPVARRGVLPARGRGGGTGPHRPAALPGAPDRMCWPLWRPR